MLVMPLPAKIDIGYFIFSLIQVLKLRTESLLPANPEILNGVDDLMQLSYLHEPSVLYNLQYRYDQDIIYVSIIPICIRSLFKMQSPSTTIQYLSYILVACYWFD